jgi:hypothetical protein
LPNVIITADKKIIKVYLKNSDGCMVIKSKLTQRLAPFSSIPKPGIKTIICKIKPAIKMYTEFFLNHIPLKNFAFAIKNIPRIPRKIEMTCLKKTETKKSISFSCESEAEKKIKEPINTKIKVVYKIFLSNFFNIFIF